MPIFALAFNFDKMWSLNEIVQLLGCKGKEEVALFAKSKEVKENSIGNFVYLRGLIEISNVCIKDCFYCGIRRSNMNTLRYSLTDNEILEAAEFAYNNNFGSIVLQGGERTDVDYVKRIERLLLEIKKISNDELGITLSLGEQSLDTYKRWFDAGAHRYLLRIETTNEELYKRIHPNDDLHGYANRLKCLDYLQQTGYQTGTGVMIGLPTQTLEDLAKDILFLKSFDIDMVGMGPYLEHTQTPLYSKRDLLLTQEERLNLTLHMIAILRIMMPDINMAATTALQAIRADGRDKAIEIGANVVMPNITPTPNRTLYKLYENKPGIHEGAESSMLKLEQSILRAGGQVAYGKWGDSLHFKLSEKRKVKSEKH